MFEVTVRCEWETVHTFEFVTEEDAVRFRERVEEGKGDGLEAIVEQGDVYPNSGELTDWSAGRVRER